MDWLKGMKIWEKSDEEKEQEADEKELKEMESLEQENIEATQKDRDTQEKEDKAPEERKYVIDGAKIKCDMCTNPEGTLKVNLDTPSIQSKTVATEVEVGPKSLVFMGNCKKSPKESVPCAAYMDTQKWDGLGQGKIQDKAPIILSSTIDCLKGSSTIKITDSGQRVDVEEGSLIPDKKDQSDIKLVSTYLHDSLKSQARDMVSKFTEDNKNIVYSIYKNIVANEFNNPEIVVSKVKYSNVAYYDQLAEVIIVSEETLIDIHESQERKIGLLSELITAYGEHLNAYLESKLVINKNLKAYDYDFYLFDGKGKSTVVFAHLESPFYTGDLVLDFKEFSFEENR